MIYLQLFLSFVKVGFTSFGGMSMVPVIMEEMGSHGWMTAEDLSNLIAIAEMTPGSLGVNCATFAGIQTAGFLGGLVAVLGVLTPALTLTLVVAIFFTRFQKNPVMQRVLRVVKPICVAMISGVLVTLFQSSILPDGAWTLRRWASQSSASSCSAQKMLHPCRHRPCRRARRGLLRRRSDFIEKSRNLSAFVSS